MIQKPRRIEKEGVGVRHRLSVKTGQTFETHKIKKSNGPKIVVRQITRGKMNLKKEKREMMIQRIVKI